MYNIYIYIYTYILYMSRMRPQGSCRPPCAPAARPLTQCVIICMCIYIYIYICVYTHTRVCVYIYIYTYVSLSLYIYIYICMYTHIYTHTGRGFLGRDAAPGLARQLRLRHDVIQYDITISYNDVTLHTTLCIIYHTRLQYVIV